MTEPKPSIFNERAAKKLRSPDDLDKYIRVTNPSVWVVLAACVALLAGLLTWGLLGSVTTSVASTSVVVDGRALCFLSADDVAKVSVGNRATVGGNSMTVSEVAAIPLSRDEADKELLSDYLVSTLVPGDWGYQVTFEGDVSDLTEGVPLSTSIVVERIAPIHLLLGRNA